jgi:hypothetical protein
MNRERGSLRLAKAFVDLQRDASIEAAIERLKCVRVQIIVTDGAKASETWQICALMVAETATRAFPGGVCAVLGTDGPALPRYLSGRSLRQELVALGVELTQSPNPELPTIVVGVVGSPFSELAVHAVPRGWAGGVVPVGRDVPAFRAGVLGAVLSGALAVSEMFLAVHQLEPRAGTRACGLSAWTPGEDWRSDGASGPPLAWGPKEAWLIGLGHLGQAVAWLLRALPYADSGDATVALQDTDDLREENLGTSILARDAGLGQRKTRIVSEALEAAGLRTQLVERLMDAQQRLQPSEPRFALAGLDSPSVRQPLSGVGWRPLIDAGLGAGAANFTEIIIQRLTTERRSEVIFDVDEDSDADALVDENPAYAAQLARGEERCGVVQAAGEAVGTAFVGAVTAALAVGEALRPLHEGPSFDVVSVDLRDPSNVRAANRQDEPIDWPVSIRLRSLIEA